MDYKEIVEIMDEYYAKTTDEIRKELQIIARTYLFHSGDLQSFCDKLHVSKHTVYMITKSSHTYRPSFEVYVRMKSIGQNPDFDLRSEKPKTTVRCIKSEEDIKAYQHNYYMEVTKKKRAERKLEESKTDTVDLSNSELIKEELR